MQGSQIQTGQSVYKRRWSVGVLQHSLSHPSFTFRKHTVTTPEILVLRRLRPAWAPVRIRITKRKQQYPGTGSAFGGHRSHFPFQRFCWGAGLEWGAWKEKMESSLWPALYSQLSRALCMWLCSCQGCKAWGSGSSRNAVWTAWFTYSPKTTHLILSPSSKGVGMNVEVIGRLHKAQVRLEAIWRKSRRDS